MRCTHLFKKPNTIKILIAIGVLLLIVIGTIVYKINSNIKGLGMDTTNSILHEDQIKEIEEREALREEQVTEVEKKPEDFYILLIGLDHRDGIFTLNTDTIIVSHVIPQNKTVKLVSLPRDLGVTNLREQKVKINSIFADGYSHAVSEARKDPSLLSGKRVKIGSSNVHEEYITSGSVLLRETVEKYLDIDIEYTFLVNFQTIISLVDEIGGIEIYVDRSMQYDDITDNTHIHLEKGWQKLDGLNALNFSRFRQDNRGPDYFSSDFERAERQQQVIMALANELSSWSNVTRIFNLLDIISANFKTDMGLNTMLTLIRQFHGSFNSESIISIPFEGTWKSPYVYIGDEELEHIKQEFSSIDLPKPEEGETEGTEANEIEAGTMEWLDRQE